MESYGKFQFYKKWMKHSSINGDSLNNLLFGCKLNGFLNILFDLILFCYYLFCYLNILWYKSEVILIFKCKIVIVLCVRVRCAEKKVPSVKLGEMHVFYEFEWVVLEWNCDFFWSCEISQSTRFKESMAIRLLWHFNTNTNLQTTKRRKGVLSEFIPNNNNRREIISVRNGHAEQYACLRCIKR